MTCVLHSSVRETMAGAKKSVPITINKRARRRNEEEFRQMAAALTFSIRDRDAYLSSLSQCHLRQKHFIHYPAKFQLITNNSILPMKRVHYPVLVFPTSELPVSMSSDSNDLGTIDIRRKLKGVWRAWTAFVDGQNLKTRWSHVV